MVRACRCVFFSMGGANSRGKPMDATSVAADMPYQETRSSTPSPQLRRFLRFGSFHLDPEQQELFKDGTRIRVQGKVCEALLLLLESPGEVVTRETLRARLWPNDSQINYDANVNTTVNKLRQVLGDSPERPAFVETIPRKGYTFIANVEAVEQPKFTDSERSAAVAQKSAGDASQSSGIFADAALGSGWFTAGVIALLIAAMLFGAAVTLFAHRPF